MPTARLKIEADAADVRRAFGQVVQASRRAWGAMTGDVRTQVARQRNELRQLTADISKNATLVMRVARAGSRARQQVEQEATRTTQTESGKRAAITETEFRQRGARLRNFAALHARVEQMRTAKTIAEVYKRIQAEDRAYDQASRRREAGARRGGGASGTFSSIRGSLAMNVFSGARRFAEDMHSDQQDARRRRAAVARTVGSAAYQAGANRAEVGELNEMVLARASSEGMSSQQLAEAVNAAQTEFSVLGNNRQSIRDPGTGQTRQETDAERRARLRTNMDRALNTAVLARDTGQDPGEVLRVSGMLQQAGITGPANRQALLALTGMAQRGAIELGGVTRSALTPIQARMATAVSRLGPDATDEQRARAQQQAVMQTMAEIEVARGMGMTARNAGNVSAMIERRITDPNVQGKMLANIQNSRVLTREQRTQAVNTLFERDAQGNQRLRAEYASGPYGLARGLQTAFNGNAEAMVNTFAGGGHGNPQSLQSNWRNMLALMMGGGGAGLPDADRDRIRSLVQGVGTDFTEGDVRRGRDIFRNDDQTTLTQNEEMHDRALRESQDRLASETRQLSDRFANWTARNPVESNAGSAVASMFGGGVTATLGSFALGAGGRAAAGRLLPGAAARLAPAALTPGGAVAGAGGVTAGGVGAVAGATLLGLTGVMSYTERTGGAGAGAYGATGMTAFQRLWDGITTGGTGAEAAARQREQQANAVRVARERREAEERRAGAEFLSTASPEEVQNALRQAIGPMGGGNSAEAARAFAQELSRMPITVRMDGHDAAQANSQRNSALNLLPILPGPGGTGGGQ